MRAKNPQAWTLEAPDGTTRHYPKIDDARVALFVLCSSGSSVHLKKVATGCWRYDVPVTGSGAKLLGPWLIYNREGLRYLQSLDYPKDLIDLMSTPDLESRDARRL